MKKMLKITQFRQSPNYCGPASLKLVFEYHGVIKSEAELARSAKTTDEGTTAENMVLTAQKYGFKARIKDNCTLDDISKFLNKKIPVIVDWFSVDDGHYSVVVGLDKTHIYLQDPEIADIRQMKLNTFFRVWFDFTGDYIKNKTDIIIRRIIVIEKSKSKKKE